MSTMKSSDLDVLRLQLNALKTAKKTKLFSKNGKRV